MNYKLMQTEPCWLEKRLDLVFFEGFGYRLNSEDTKNISFLDNVVYYEEDYEDYDRFGSNLTFDNILTAYSEYLLERYTFEDISKMMVYHENALEGESPILRPHVQNNKFK